MNTEFKHLGFYIKTGKVSALQLFTVYLYIDGYQVRGLKEPRKTLLPFYRIDISTLFSRINRTHDIVKYRQDPQTFMNDILRTARIPRTHILHPDNERYISHRMSLEEIAFRAHAKTLPKNVAHSHGNHSGNGYADFTDVQQMRDHIHQFLSHEFIVNHLIRHSEIKELLLTSIGNDLNPYLITNPTPFSLAPIPFGGL